MFDAKKNFATGTVAVGGAPSPDTSGLSMTLTAGNGAKAPTVPFNMTLWPSGVQPTDANAEIVRVTKMTGDVVNTMLRGQEGSTAQPIAAGYQWSAGATKKALTDLETATLLRALTRMEVYGHSFAVGGGASDSDRDVMTKLASMIGPGTLEVNRAFGGAIAHWANFDPYSTTGNGGWNTVMQFHRTPRRPFAKLTANSNSGVSTITVGTRSNGEFANTMLIHVGIGANAQTRTVISGGGTGTLTLDKPLTANVVTGDPVFQVPHAYEAMCPLYLFWLGEADVAACGFGNETNPLSATGKDGKAAYMHAKRACVARLRCAEVFDADHSSITLGGSAVAAYAGAAGSHEGSFIIGRAAFAALSSGDTITVQLPANFPGGTVDMAFINAFQTGSTTRSGSLINFTVDGVSFGTLDTRLGAYKFSTTVKMNQFVKRLTGISAGQHTIVATFSTTAVASTYFDWYGIEATTPPIIVLPSNIRGWTYKAFDVWEYTELSGTTNANHAGGGTISSFTITAAQNPVPANQIMKAGEYITFDYGGANEETLIVAAEVAAGATTVTTTTPAQLAHNTGQPYRAQMHDNAIVLSKQWDIALAAEFDAAVIYVDADKLIHGNDGTAGLAATKDATAFTYDAIHPNDIGNERLAKGFYQELQTAAALTTDLVASLAVPAAPLPGTVYLMGPLVTATAAPNAPGGAGVMAEAFTVAHRQLVDLRRARYGRLLVGYAANALAARVGKLEYLAPDGVTWKTLGRKQTGANTTNVSVAPATTPATEPGTADLAAAPPLVQLSKPEVTLVSDGWFYLPTEVTLMKGTLLRYVHGNGSATPPIYVYIAAQFT